MKNSFLVYDKMDKFIAKMFAVYYILSERCGNSTFLNKHRQDGLVCFSGDEKFNFFPLLIIEQLEL